MEKLKSEISSFCYIILNIGLYSQSSKNKFMHQMLILIMNYPTQSLAAVPINFLNI